MPITNLSEEEQAEVVNYRVLKKAEKKYKKLEKKEEKRKKAEMENAIVYITNSGDKYHTDGCSYLRSSANPIKYKEAKSMGYGSCSRCNPDRWLDD